MLKRSAFFFRITQSYKLLVLVFARNCMRDNPTNYEFLFINIYCCKNWRGSHWDSQRHLREKTQRSRKIILYSYGEIRQEEKVRNTSMVGATQDASKRGKSGATSWWRWLLSCPSPCWRGDFLLHISRERERELTANANPCWKKKNSIFCARFLSRIYFSRGCFSSN